MEAEALGNTVSGSGLAEFQVGAQGFFQILPPAELEITEGGDDYALLFTVVNLFPEDQLLSADVNRDSELYFNIIDARVDAGDRDFVLLANQSRVITVFLELSDDNLDNLMENRMSFDLVLEVDGDRDKVSMAGTVTLVKPVPEETGPDVEETAWWLSLIHI